MLTRNPRTLRRAFWAFNSLFLLLFFARLLYGYYYPHDSGANPGQSQAEFSGGRKNYASEKIGNKGAGSGQIALPNQVNPLRQKYEKVATLSARTNQFEQDEATLKRKITAFQAVVQFDQNNGHDGQRVLQLLVGIPPGRFDSFYVEMQQTGRILNKQVTKTDKTNEYLQLNAQITSLSKTRDALLELKSRAGRIDEYIGLVNRILEIETQLQELGVQMGNYDEENEFCSVRFTLSEWQSTHISLAQRLKVAFEWAVEYFCILSLGLVFALIGALILLQILDKIKSSHPPPLHEHLNNIWRQLPKKYWRIGKDSKQLHDFHSKTNSFFAKNVTYPWYLLINFLTL